MKTDADRIASYDAKTVPANVALVVTAQLPDMKSGFSAAITSLAAIEMQIQGLLNSASVPTISYPFYLNFGREMWSLSRRGFSDASFTAMAQSLLEKYIGYGLVKTYLVLIASVAFTQNLT